MQLRIKESKAGRVSGIVNTKISILLREFFNFMFSFLSMSLTANFINEIND